CDDVSWARRGELAITAHRTPPEPGPGFDLSTAVIVVDPGHGGENNIGAVGRQGTPEKTINQLIAGRLRDLLQSSHLIDWETGDIYTGDEVPAVGAVLMTRSPGVLEGDYEAGLIFRATLANAAGADVLMSIHNNAGHEIDLLMPGSDVFYQSQSDDSRRLAALLAEEFQRSFEGFNASWVGAEFVGAKSRLSPRDRTSQYYGILRRSEVPAVIAEGSYLSNPDEEALLNTARFQQAYAEAAYRAIVRFLTTDDVGGESTDPEVWEGFAGSGAPATECLVPSQP
ncbi:MAG: N-acetylmuramoyl-L-alanine amidase, partial [Acidimicrobiia bacterium]|nr:N-acetylmuramoyl-L-alanine amidase [Acidimicrobiia bacterium]